jgi:AMIN domain-containing protein
MRRLFLYVFKSSLSFAGLSIADLFIAGALLAFAALPAPVSAQSGARNAAGNNARVQHVIVRGSDGAMEVEIQTSGAPVAPDTQAIGGPDRIIVDFPGALPDAELRALKVNRGALKGVRAGLFFQNPPITRVVLDLTAPQPYQISTKQNAVVVKLNPVKLNPAKLTPVDSNPVKLNQAKLDPAISGAEKLSSAVARSQTLDVHSAPAAKLQNTALVAGTMISGTRVASTNVASTTATAPRVSAAVSNAIAPPAPAVRALLPPMPLVTVTFANGMLRIHAEKATLSEVLFEVQRQTHAEIPIPAGAEREEVIADLGPAPARDVLAALLNGSPYNFIFVGNELRLERVILTLR